MIDFNAPRPKKRKAPPMQFVQPVSREFPIDWVEPGDILDLEANALEALCLLTRARDRVLRRHSPLSKVSSYRPTGADKPLSELSAVELALLVTELREKAERARAMAILESVMQAAE